MATLAEDAKDAIGSRFSRFILRFSKKNNSTLETFFFALNNRSTLVSVFLTLEKLENIPAVLHELDEIS